MPTQASGTERNTMEKILFTKPLVSIRTVPQTQPLPSPPFGAGMRFSAANLMVAASSSLAPPANCLPEPPERGHLGMQCDVSFVTK